MRLLIVRLSSLGDCVHTIPVAAALRRRFPDADLDWLVDTRYRELIELVPAVTRAVTVDSGSLNRFTRVIQLVRDLRRRSYDVVIDAQGLWKSAVIARLCGARRVVGFGSNQVREWGATWLYTDTVTTPAALHVIEKNLALAVHLGAESGVPAFPVAEVTSDAPARARLALGIDATASFAILNPGAAWSSKCWIPASYGALARRLRDRHALRSTVTWGPGEKELAGAVVEASDGAAALAPATSVADLVALMRAAAIVVGGDTGPFHIAAAVGTPVVGLYGPSDPARNGPWGPNDLVVSRFDRCGCRKVRGGFQGVVVRRCVQSTPCLADVTTNAVADAVARRLASVQAHA